MPSFRYSAIDQTGRPFAGTLDADNLEAVRNKLAELRYHIVSINEAGTTSSFNDIFKSWSRVKQKELVLFSRQFATMIDAGLSVLKCLDILQRQSKDPVLCDALVTIRHDVNSGASLTEAMAKHPRVFNKLYVNMIRSAEAGGILDQVLDRLATFQEKDLEMKPESPLGHDVSDGDLRIRFHCHGRDDVVGAAAVPQYFRRHGHRRPVAVHHQRVAQFFHPSRGNTGTWWCFLHRRRCIAAYYAVWAHGNRSVAIWIISSCVSRFSAISC